MPAPSALGGGELLAGPRSPVGATRRASWASGGQAGRGRGGRRVGKDRPWPRGSVRAAGHSAMEAVTACAHHLLGFPGGTRRGGCVRSTPERRGVQRRAWRRSGPCPVGARGRRIWSPIVAYGRPPSMRGLQTCWPGSGRSGTAWPTTGQAIWWCASEGRRRTAPALEAVGRRAAAVRHRLQRASEPPPVGADRPAVPRPPERLAGPASGSGGRPAGARRTSEAEETLRPRSVD